MANDDDTEHDPWCAEHDPNGTCLGDVKQLPGGGAVWIEGGEPPKIVMSLGRSDGRHLSELGSGDVRRVIVTLEDLADQVDGRDRG